jgi:hypothetical protein
VVAIIYIGRFLQHGQSAATGRNLPRLFTTALSIAFKFFCDDLRATKAIAKYGGVSVIELVRLERIFLDTINFNLFISELEYGFYTDEIHSC